jgi:membrane-associated phospholipid phosphatase/SAM-dependent methyltransferase
VSVSSTGIRTQLGVVLFGLCLPLVAFAFLAEEASEGERLPWDQAIAGLLDRRAGLAAPGVDDLLAFAIWGGAILAGATALLLVSKARSRQVAFWTVAITGVAVIELSLSGLARLLEGSGASFPSASATVAMAAVGALVVLARPSRRRVLVSTLGGLFVVGYGFSLVYLGWSNPSYVVAGWCVSVAWVSGLRLALPLDSGAPTSTASLRSVARGMLRRQPVDDVLDWVRFRIDTFPRNLSWLKPLGLPELQDSTYHELPWVGVRGGRRVESTKSRWERIAPLVEAHGVRSVVDIGSSAGWFGFKLAERGVRTIAVERSPRGLRLGLYTRKKSGLDQVSFLAMEATPSTVELLPAADCILLLSVWHHFVREWGFEAATEMLAQIWEKAGSLLFFETGEDEMPASWQLPPMLPDAHSWLTDFLASVCAEASIEHLGHHDALDPENEPCRRNLFVAVREAQQQV